MIQWDLHPQGDPQGDEDDVEQMMERKGLSLVDGVLYQVVKPPALR